MTKGGKMKHRIAISISLVTITCAAATAAPSDGGAVAPPGMPGAPTNSAPTSSAPTAGSATDAEVGSGSGSAIDAGSGTGSATGAESDEARRAKLVQAPLRPEDHNVDLRPIDSSGIVQPPAHLVPAPVGIAASGFMSGYGYSRHPTRAGGFESQLRGDLWNSTNWGAHAAYTVDVIDADDNLSGTKGAEGFHDLDLGGSMAFERFPVPVWAFAEVHLFAGDTTYGTGIAEYVGAGAHVGPERWAADVELGVGEAYSSGDASPMLSLRVAEANVKPWLGVAANMIVTDDGPANAHAGTGGGHVAAGPEFKLGPWRRFSFVVDGLFGSRAFAMISRGQIIENVPDVYHTTIRLFVWMAVTDRLRLYAGSSYRTATADVMDNYTLVSGFAGAVVGF